MNKDFTIVDKCVLLIGKRGSGKSVLLKNMLSYYGKTFSKIYACSGTEEVNQFYTKSGLIPPNCVFENYSEEWGVELISQMKAANRGVELHQQRKVLLILDDCIADTNFHQSKTLKNMFANGRHYSLSLIITTQHLHSVSPLQRGNCDYCFIGQQNNESIEILCSTYLSGKITKKQFIELYDNSTLDYNFFAINCNSVKNRDDLNELYGKIRASEKYRIVNEVIEEEKTVMKADDSWDGLFSKKKIKTKVIHKRLIEKKVLIVVKPLIQNVA